MSCTQFAQALQLLETGTVWVSSLLTPLQDQEPRSHHGFGDKEEAGLGLRPGIWGTGCSAKEQDLVLQGLSDMTQCKEIPVKGGRARTGPWL